MGSADVGDLVQAVSALANPNLKRNTITWQGRKAHASGALMEGRTIALLWPPLPPYLTRKTIYGQKWRAIALPVYATACWAVFR